MTVPPILVRRLKSHFVTLPCGVDLILALNGYIWVSKHVKENEQEGEEGFDAEAVYSNQNDVSQIQLRDSAVNRIFAGNRRIYSNRDITGLKYHSHFSFTLRAIDGHDPAGGI